jgi:hypothetical protein
MKKIIFADIKNTVFESEKFMQALYINSKGILDSAGISEIIDEASLSLLDNVYSGYLGENRVNESPANAKNKSDKRAIKKHHKYVVFTKSLIKEFYPYKNFTIVFKFS